MTRAQPSDDPSLHIMTWTPPSDDTSLHIMTWTPPRDAEHAMLPSMGTTHLHTAPLAQLAETPRAVTAVKSIHTMQFMQCTPKPISLTLPQYNVVACEANQEVNERGPLCCGVPVAASHQCSEGSRGQAAAVVQCIT